MKEVIGKKYAPGIIAIKVSLDYSRAKKFVPILVLHDNPDKSGKAHKSKQGWMIGRKLVTTASLGEVRQMKQRTFV